MSEAPFDVTARVAEDSDAEPFPEANKPEMIKLWLDLGEESRQSAAKLGYHHDAADLVGQQVLCVTDLGSIRIAGFNSEALTLGVPGDDGNPVLVTPENPSRSTANCTERNDGHRPGPVAESRIPFLRGNSYARR